jgi:hypothetical protein
MGGVVGGSGKKNTAIGTRVLCATELMAKV